MPTGDQIVLSVMLLFIGALMYYVPVMKGQDAFFGIAVSSEFYRGPIARRCLRTYRSIVMVLVGGSLGFLLTSGRLHTMSVGVVLGVILVASLGPAIPLFVFWRALRPHEAKPEVDEAAVTEEAPGDKWRHVAPWIEAVLSVALIALIGLTLWRYPQLPERIPIHWNAAGQADGWQHKNPYALLSLLLLLGFFHVMLLWLLVGMAQAPVRLPAERAEEYRAVRARYMRVWVQFLNAMRMMLALIFGGIIWASLFGIEQQAQGGAPPGMILVLVGMAALLGALPWIIVRGFRLRAEMREIAGPGFLESTAPTEGWIGGVIYYNKSDPAVWVEKRIGVGWTVNFAHPIAWLIIIMAIVVPLGIMLIGLAGAGNK